MPVLYGGLRKLHPIDREMEHDGSVFSSWVYGRSACEQRLFVAKHPRGSALMHRVAVGIIAQFLMRIRRVAGYNFEKG
jgi:hypothetical protein